MGSALSSGVTGLQAHQKMLEVAGNNLANVNTAGFKGSRIGFSDLLSETIRKAASAGSNLGGTNPQQMGSGVGISSITRDMSQGGFESTGQALDMAISGDGYFVLNNGTENVYTRVGSFGIDSDSNLVDPATGYRVQRIGSAGEAEGFQTVGNSNITIPYGAAMPAKATSTFNLSGNLRSEGGTPTANILSSGIGYTLASDGSNADSSTLLTDLKQFSGTFNAADTITISGTDKANGAVGPVTWTVPAGATLGDLATQISSAYTGSTAKIVNGEIRLTDDTAGFSYTDLNLSYNGAGTADLETPGYFQLLQAGGEDMKLTSIDIYDASGGKHTLSGAFVKSDTTANSWDFVLTKLTGKVDSIVNRRIEGVNFTPEGAYLGISGSTDDFSFKFSSDPATTQSITMSAGTIGMYDGLTQFKAGEGASSTAAASNQNGYAAGELADVSSSDGKLIGTFSNGEKKTIATIQLATFQNSGGLESIGQNYFTASANSGDPIATESGSGGAGRVEGQKLEKSNVQVAQEFVTMIQAQNGFQANARTISVANDVLRELTNLIR